VSFFQLDRWNSFSLINPVIIVIAFLFVCVLCDCFKPRRRLEAAILVLRHKLNVQQQHASRRLRLRGADRALFIGSIVAILAFLTTLPSSPFHRQKRAFDRPSILPSMALPSWFHRGSTGAFPVPSCPEALEGAKCSAVAASRICQRLS
jgi:hypothetical protein